MSENTPSYWREYFRRNGAPRSTAALAPGYVQANLIVLPKENAWDFMLFCVRNPKPCPLLDVTEPGDPVPHIAAPDADLRTDLCRYVIYEDGVRKDEVENILDVWRKDLVCFLLGCNFSMDPELKKAGIPVPHEASNNADAMYISSIQSTPAGVFRGPVVVSLRAIAACHVSRAVQITSRYPACHGAPVHIGDPRIIGISDLSRVDFGNPTPVRSGEVPVFWGCGVTPQAIAMGIRLPFMITHKPGHMFLTDLTLADVAAY